jgi:hypothetical protein
MCARVGEVAAPVMEEQARHQADEANPTVE